MPAAEWRVARLATRRRAAVTRAQVETVSGRALGLFGLVFGAQTLPARARRSRRRSSRGRARRSWPCSTARWRPSPSRRSPRSPCASPRSPSPCSTRSPSWRGRSSSPTPRRWRARRRGCTTSAPSRRRRPSSPCPAPIAAGIHDRRAGRSTASSACCPPAAAAVPLLAVLDAMYAVILGSVVLIIVTMLRQAAEAVDSAQEAALQRYDLAARQHATEIERVKVDALVHDSVLTTLLSAAAADSPEEEALAARMARDAVKRLDEAGAEGPRALETVGLPGARPAAAGARSRPSPRRSPCASSNAGGVELPVEAVDALYSAAVQAMVNSMQHADEPGRSTRARAAHPRRPGRRLRHRGRRRRRRLRSPRRARRAARAARLHRGAHRRTPAAPPRSSRVPGTAPRSRSRGPPAAVGGDRHDRRPPLAPARARGAVLRLPRRARHLHARRAASRRGRPWSPWCSTRSRPSRACGRCGACACPTGSPRSTWP